MVDFARILEESRARMTPEQRERADARAAEEARWEATAEDIVAIFERLEYRVEPSVVPTALRRGGMLFRAPPRPPAAKGPAELVVGSRREATLRLRIEEIGDGAERREVLRFIGGPTGHEAYTLDSAFCAMVTDPEERRARPLWYICAGTPGRWDACHVAHDDIEAYVRRWRPSLFPGATPGPR